MTKIICDLCGKEISTQDDGELFKNIKRKGFYRLDMIFNDLCPECQKKWEKHKEQICEKYDKLHDELYAKEREEILSIKEVTNGETNDKDTATSEAVKE